MSPEASLDRAVERLTKRLAKGAGIVFIGQVAGRFLAFGLQLVLGRLLGAAGYGLYALAISTMEFGARLSQLGLANGLVRYVAVYRAEGNLGRLKGTLVSGFSLGSGASILGAVGLFLAAPWIAERFFNQPGLVLPVRLMAFALPFYNLVMLVQSGLRGAQCMASFTLIGLARLAMTLVLTASLVWAGFGVLGALGGFIASALLTLLFSLLILVKSVPQGTWKVKSEWQWKELLRFSLPLYIAGFSFLLMSRTDILMLGYFTSPENVGAYRASVALAWLVFFGVGAINTAFAPLIADLYHQSSMAELEVMYKMVTRWGMLLSLTIALPFLLFPREVLGVYGHGFIKAAWPLVILTAFQLINAGLGSGGFMLQMSGRQDWVLANNLFTATLNVGLNLWWVPQWGISGAALATGIALALNNFLSMIEVRWLLGVHPFSWDYARLAWPVLASLGTFLLFRWLGWKWWQTLFIILLTFEIVFFSCSTNNMDRLVFRAFLKRVKILH